MAEPAITIEGLDRLIDKLGKVEGLDFMKGVMHTAGSMLKNFMAVYPHKTAANRPGGPGSRWYERGYGPRWMRADGSVGGRQTSETLGRRWTSRVQGKTSAIVGNNASYAPYVQSAAKQAAWMSPIGWRTDQEGIDEVGPQIVEMAATEIERVLEGK